MLEFINVCKKYGEKIALDNVSFKVNNGEIVGFIGPNGSGKTTSIKLITNIINLTSGDIIVNNKSVLRQAFEIKKEIGYISDSPDMFLRLKGIEYLNFIADTYDVDMEERKRRIDEYAKLFELEDSLNQPMINYSHGMRQKLMVMASLIHNPEVLLLDEPLTGLDPKSALNLKNIMKEYKQNNKTVFFSTHVLEVAESLCDRIIFIYKSRIIFDGTIDDLKNKYPDKSLEEIYVCLINENS